MKQIAVLAGLFLCLFVGGCKDPYGGCAKAGADIAAGVSTGLSTVTSLHQQGELSATEAQNVANYLEFVNKGDEAFLVCVGAAHAGGNKPGTFSACAQVFNASLNTPAELALIHVSNPQASETVNTIVNGFTTAVTAIESQLGGA